MLGIGRIRLDLRGLHGPRTTDTRCNAQRHRADAAPALPDAAVDAFAFSAGQVSHNVEQPGRQAGGESC